jgi:cell division protein FtsI (penicillin-binding protein 3)
MTAMHLEIPEVGKPQIPSPWRDINTLTASYGHGLATTPLQMTSAVASIANGGYLVKPQLVMNGHASEEKQDESLRVVSAQTAHRMLQLLRLVVTDGTGANADVPGYRVGGKTGTAEQPGKHGYDHKRLISSFVGIFPVDEPQYAIFIAIDQPKGNAKSYGYATGGWVAAPAVARTIASMGSILGMPPKAGDSELSASLKQYVMVKVHE